MVDPFFYLVWVNRLTTGMREERSVASARLAYAREREDTAKKLVRAHDSPAGPGRHLVDKA